MYELFGVYIRVVPCAAEAPSEARLFGARKIPSAIIRPVARDYG
jgi:hypothetical protein